MNKSLCLLCLFGGFAAQAGSSSILLEIKRSVPEIEESYKISNEGDHEELVVTSNGFSLPRQEIGKYSRPVGDFSSQIDKIKDSLSDTDYKIPQSRTINLSGWHVFIRGEEIDATDPRYNQAFDLLRNQINHGAWYRKDVTVATLNGLILQLTRWHYPDGSAEDSKPQMTKQTLQGLAACKNVVAGRLVCHVPHGFIYLNDPANKK